VFRDGELGRNHLPEFTMAEWYRLDFGLDQIMREAADFISTLLELPQMANNPDFRTYRDIFETALRIDPFTVGLDRLRDAAQADDGLRSSLGDDRDAWLDLLLSGTVVRGFPTDRLTVVTHYPASQAVLARLCPADAAMADRFEIFLGPLELANGFVELLDADEQAARFERDRATRRRQGKPVHDVDRELLAALRSGLPQCAGVAVGFDRLLMLHQDAPDVAAISHFVY
jgi:lysyl-tRNA synthetase class 2